jgi:hypothetical protein
MCTVDFWCDRDRQLLFCPIHDLNELAEQFSQQKSASFSGALFIKLDS